MVIGAIAGAVAALFRLMTLASKLGASAQRIESAQKSFAEKVAVLDQIPTIIMRIGIIEQYVAKNTSDIKDLIGRTGEHRGRLESLHDIDERTKIHDKE